MVTTRLSPTMPRSPADRRVVPLNTGPRFATRPPRPEEQMLVRWALTDTSPPRMLRASASALLRLPTVANGPEVPPLVAEP